MVPENSVLFSSLIWMFFPICFINDFQINSHDEHISQNSFSLFLAAVVLLLLWCWWWWWNNFNQKCIKISFLHIAPQYNRVLSDHFICRAGLDHALISQFYFQQTLRPPWQTKLPFRCDKTQWSVGEHQPQDSEAGRKREQRRRWRRQRTTYDSTVARRWSNSFLI